MTLLLRLAALLGLLALAQLTSCAPYEHAMRAPRRARHTYQRAERQHAHQRRRAGHALIFWN